MLEFFLEILGFGLKLILLVVLLVFPVMVFIAVALKGRKNSQNKGAQLGYENIAFLDLKRAERKRQRFMEKHVKAADPAVRLEKRELSCGLDPEKAKEKEKADKKKKSKQGRKEQVESQVKERQSFVEELEKKRAAGEFCPRNLFVLDFRGSTKGTEFKQLRLQVDAILSVATKEDEVVVNLCSPGGMVNTYGLCAAQLQRLRDRGIFLTVTVDEVAASGGYLMACVANKIVAAPFAYIGSIGVIAGMPNFRRALDKVSVDYEQITAGKYKRTLSMLGENTEEGRKKFREELEAVHKRFKALVQRYRPKLDIEKVATGEHWLAADALKLKLIDELSTSDEYIHERLKVTENSALKLTWKKEAKKTNWLKLFLTNAHLLAPRHAERDDTTSDETTLPSASALSALGAATTLGEALASSSHEESATTALQAAQEQLQSLEQSSYLNMR